MRDGEIDDVLRKAAQAHPGPDPALLDRIARSIEPTVGPVKPLPAEWQMVAGLAALGAAIALAGAARIGFVGARLMSSGQMLVFPALAVLMVAAAASWIAEMIPGKKRFQGAVGVLCDAVFVLCALFLALFPDRANEKFIHAGMVCLGVGLLHGLPIGLAGWWYARRGYAVNPTLAALAAGTLAGLGGVLVLELHCPNFELAHLLVWHTAVIPAAAALAMLLTKLVQVRRAHAASH